jgi:hypothetical protein
MTVFATWTNMVSHYTQTVASRLYVVPRAGVILKEARETLDDRQQRAISQAAIGQAPSITFAQVWGLAMKQRMTRDLVGQFQEDMKRTREVLTRVWDARLGGVVMPYWAVIQTKRWQRTCASTTRLQEASIGVAIPRVHFRVY